MQPHRLTKEGYTILPEVEIPLTVDINEMSFFKERIDNIASQVMQRDQVKFHYTSGTMIELPRAALLADELAEVSDFFSFGTNDLTQTTFGFSRDDAEGKFLTHYLEKKIIKENPFIVLDRKGVGKLMRLAVEGGRKLNPDSLSAFAANTAVSLAQWSFATRSVWILSAALLTGCLLPAWPPRKRR